MFLPEPNSERIPRGLLRGSSMIDVNNYMFDNKRITYDHASSFKILTYLIGMVYTFTVTKIINGSEENHEGNSICGEWRG